MLRTASLALLACLCATIAQASWSPSEGDSRGFVATFDPEVTFADSPALRLDNDGERTNAVTVILPTEQFRGQRVRFAVSCLVEPANRTGESTPNDWNGIWVRINQGLVSRIIYGREFCGLSRGPAANAPPQAWQRNEVVVDISPAAQRVTVGLGSSMAGKVWFGGLTVEPVGLDVPVNRVDDEAMADDLLCRKEPVMSHIAREVCFSSLTKSINWEASPNYIHTLTAQETSAGGPRWQIGDVTK